jgi:hypothetical protein
MDSGFLAYLSWREVLVAAVVLLVLYILFAFLRINRLRDEARSAQQWSQLSPGEVQSAVRSYVAEQEPDRDAPAVPDDAAQAARADPPAFAGERTREEPLAVRREQRRTEVLEQDVAQLRREIGGLRAELQALREEQQHEIGKAQITQDTSPFYNDAMQLATQGRDAADISVLCGISRAEAELVVALAKNQTLG